MENSVAIFSKLDGAKAMQFLLTRFRRIEKFLLILISISISVKEKTKITKKKTSNRIKTIFRNPERIQTQFNRSISILCLSIPHLHSIPGISSRVKKKKFQLRRRLNSTRSTRYFSRIRFDDDRWSRIRVARARTRRPLVHKLKAGVESRARKSDSLRFTDTRPKKVRPS